MLIALCNVSVQATARLVEYVPGGFGRTAALMHIKANAEEDMRVTDSRVAGEPQANCRCAHSSAQPNCPNDNFACIIHQLLLCWDAAGVDSSPLHIVCCASCLSLQAGITGCSELSCVWLIAVLQLLAAWTVGSLPW